jgi:hypothetical protein
MLIGKEKIMKITRTSPFTGIENTLDINITEEQLKQWTDGLLAQLAFPNLSADDREFIMTGITAEEWDTYIGKGE